MRKWWIRILSLVGIAIILGGVIWYKQQASVILPEPGHKPPAFTLESLQGQMASPLTRQGKPVFINFWASWCPPCRAETPDLEKMYRKYGKRIAFYGIDLTNNDTIKAVQAFRKQFGVTYPILLDKTGSVQKAYDIVGIPTSLFVSRKGIVQDRIMGQMSKAIMQTQFSRLLDAGK